LHYNSWYDLRTNELTPETLVRTFEDFKRSVLDPFGLRMHAFVPDDGWQNPQSIWVPRSNLYPEGFGPLRGALESRGTRLGLWLPFNGFNLDVAWGAERGYERSNQGRYYCLVGPKYNAAIRGVAKRLVDEGNIGYFKHDFNQLRCSADGHGHLPADRHGRETNLNAQLGLLAYERELQPDVYLNVTSYVWHSPWWLRHADTIWMAAGDFGYNHDWPQLSPREWAMSYRDAHFYKLYAEQHTLVPLSAMMTHGIIHGRYQLLGGSEETLREWSDYVVMYYGRGVQLMEWYITPELMSPQRWEILGRATRWAIENRDVLENVVMAGGDPRKGQPYGYVHWSGDRGILVLRNPNLREQEISIPFDKSVRYRGERGRLFHGRTVYPFVERLPAHFESGQPVRLKIPGCSVMICELAPSVDPAPAPIALPPAPAANAEVAQGEAGQATVRAHVSVPAEGMLRCDLYFVVGSRSRVSPPACITLAGNEVTARQGRGSDWTIHSVDLRDQRGQTVEVLLAFEHQDRPFSWPEAMVSAWLVMDRPVAEVEGTFGERLPLPISQGYRRQTIQVLGDTKVERRANRRRITAAELKRVEAAKLRILVFDSNGEPRYRDKFIFLNGAKLAAVPANTGPLSAWQERVIDLPPEHLQRLRMSNEVEVSNPAGDYFKFADVSLAVRLADGTWTETLPQTQVYSSIASWTHAEGTVFTEGRSGVIRLRFE
ncbi:MAG: alpha-galactosidase, partial [Planctomycetota bacterium]